MNLSRDETSSIKMREADKQREMNEREKENDRGWEIEGEGAILARDEVIKFKLQAAGMSTLVILCCQFPMTKSNNKLLLY